jgi:hypothetical protein
VLDKREPIHQNLLPEMRSRWLMYQGAQRVAEAAVKEANDLGRQYQDMLTAALQVGGYDPDMQWRVNLTTGEVESVRRSEGGERRMAEARGRTPGSPQGRFRPFRTHGRRGRAVSYRRPDGGGNGIGNHPEALRSPSTSPDTPCPGLRVEDVGWMDWLRRAGIGLTQEERYQAEVERERIRFEEMERRLSQAVLEHRMSNLEARLALMQRKAHNQMAEQGRTVEEGKS